MQQFVDTKSQSKAETPKEQLAQVKALELADQQTKKTRGEKVFNLISWVFFGWIVNAAASIKFADVLTVRYRPYFLKQSQEFAKSLPFRKTFGEMTENGVKIATDEGQKMARSLFGVVALLPGGFVVLAPIKWMEDRKHQIVQFFDRKFGSNQTDEQKAAVQARHEYIAQAPVPSMLEMAQGRILPIIGILVMHFSVASGKTNIVNGISKMLGGKPDIFPGWGSYIGKLPALAEKIPGVKSIKAWYMPKAQNQIDGFREKYTGYYSEETLENAYGAHSKAKINGKERYDNYVENIGIDFSYSAVVAAATYALSHMFAWNRAEKRAARGQSYQTPVANAAAAESRDVPQAELVLAAASQTERPHPHVDAAHYKDRLIDPALVLQHGA